MFLKQLPFLTHWSKNLLSKLTYLVEKIDTIRGQHIMREREELQYIYIVRSGEFEVYKNCKIDNKEEK